jgi:hypothetical protein
MLPSQSSTTCTDSVMLPAERDPIAGLARDRIADSARWAYV